MATRAHIVHRMIGRARLRVPSRRGDTAYFTEVERTLGACPAVEWVLGSSQTAGLLIYYTGELDLVLAYASERRLFDVGDPRDEERDVPVGATLRRIYDEAASMNARHHVEGRGAGDLRTLLFYGLIGASAYQLIRGNFIPPGGTLLAYAAGLIVRTVYLDPHAPKARSAS